MQKLTRWGNSTGLRIPSHVLDAAGLKAGAYVHVRLLDSGDIRVRPAKNTQPADAEGAVTHEPPPPPPLAW
ncbi:AbrB/MazE/SpoVT family DNA-binding domain-containing protein [Polaromonas sp. OV174]|uniref:AbrB/MazE/SpoVT family DNA-binding domain-containing protein n=1 Tax=Polaromonas sp. OV174 TaxID=1855300 RepID=UPI0035114E87